MRLALLASLAMPLLLGGCVSRAPAPGDVTWLESGPATGSVSADDVYPLAEADWMYRLNDEAGPTLTIQMRETERFGARWSRGQDGGRIEYWSRDDDENLVLMAAIDHEEKALSIFKPPLVIAWANLEPETPRSSESAMRVVELSNPRRQRESGTATNTIEYVGDEEIQTPLGRFHARRIEVRFTADLKMADVDNQTVLLVVPERGIILQQRREQIRVLGIPSTKEVTRVLLEIRSEATASDSPAVP